MESSSKEIHTRIFGALGTLYHALGCSCLGCSTPGPSSVAFAVLALVIFWIYSVLSLFPGWVVSSSKDRNFCVQQRQVLVLIPFLPFSCASQTPMAIPLKPELLFSVCSESEVCPCRRVCSFVLRWTGRAHTEPSYLKGSFQLVCPAWVVSLWLRMRQLNLSKCSISFMRSGRSVHRVLSPYLVWKDLLESLI